VVFGAERIFVLFLDHFWWLFAFYVEDGLCDVEEFVDG
jgi:hypothetical protein